MMQHTKWFAAEPEQGTQEEMLMKRTALIALPIAAITGASVLGLTSVKREAPAPVQSTETAQFDVDGVHSSVVFRVKHVNASMFYGRFNDVSGSIGWEDGRVASADVTVQTASVDTGNKNRDDHLRNADFFNARQYPTITFKGVSEDGKTLKGDLTLHGTTKPITAGIVMNGEGEMRGSKKVGFEARFSIKRGDFGVVGYLADDGGDDGPIGNTVDLMVAIEGG